jgi:hypothetical protein
MSSKTTATSAATCFFYVNGILNSKNDVQNTAEKIQKITNKPVHFHHNDAATPEQLVGVVAPIAVGLMCALYSSNEEKKGKGTKASRLVGGVGLVALVYGLIKYKDMQERKNELSIEIANRVNAICTGNDSYSCALVLHSQGADVGARVLELLSEECQKKVRVVTLGGMVAIAEERCQYAINFQLNADPVPGVVGSALNFLSEKVDGYVRRTCKIASNSAGTFAHSVAEYLAHPEIEKTLKKLAHYGEVDSIEKLIELYESSADNCKDKKL